MPPGEGFGSECIPTPPICVPTPRMAGFSVTSRLRAVMSELTTFEPDSWASYLPHILRMSSTSLHNLKERKKPKGKTKMINYPRMISMASTRIHIGLEGCTSPSDPSSLMRRISIVKNTSTSVSSSKENFLSNRNMTRVHRSSRGNCGRSDKDLIKRGHR